jgi:pantetheine-phosphate adenylyltransferase
MSRSVIAVYSGTFDPLTLGHEDVIYRASQMFDKVVVAVATAHHKKTLFTLDERLAMAQEVTQDLGNYRFVV